MPKFQKKPVTVEAIQYSKNPSNHAKIAKLARGRQIAYPRSLLFVSPSKADLSLKVPDGSWIVEDGPFDICVKSDIDFKKEYVLICDNCEGSVECHKTWCSRAWDGVEVEDEQ